MFDIGFSEIVVCAIVALLVIGPERMPETVRTIGLWIGRLKRSLHETRTEIERQIGVDDIRRQLHNEDIMRSIEAARANMDNIMAEAQASANALEHAYESEPNYKSEPDLPYHAHTEAADAPESLADSAENSAELLPNPVAAPAKPVATPAKKVQLEKQPKPANALVEPLTAQPATATTQPLTSPSDTKAAL